MPLYSRDSSTRRHVLMGAAAGAAALALPGAGSAKMAMCQTPAP